jgi:hypothetical protein
MYKRALGKYDTKVVYIVVIWAYILDIIDESVKLFIDDKLSVWEILSEL